MADKSSQLILDALTRAVAQPAGRPLFGTKARPGLFADGALARQAAQQCKDANYLRVVGTEKRGKSEIEICAITQPGLDFLLAQGSPRPILEELARAVQEGSRQVAQLQNAAQTIQATLEQLSAAAEQALHQIAAAPAVGGNGTPAHDGVADWLPAAVDHLDRWQHSHPTEDCSLPELYRQAQRQCPTLTIGAFHDGLRRLREQQKIYLHPWTGPLHEMPEPALALLVGHEIAYYASQR